MASSGNKRVYRIDPDDERVDLLIDGAALGMADLGNCEYDGNGNIWINEITGCRIWQFDPNGQLMNRLGTGTPGFQKEETSFENVQFNWIYDLRRGPDGNIYVLDSRNYAVRLIDISAGTVTCVAGTGEPGYSGDGGDASRATFGGDPAATFDGPWSLAVDEEGHLYIGDTQNHVMRMVDKKSNTIRTIAGNHQSDIDLQNNPNETDPMRFYLPVIFSLDYYAGRLFIPEWDGDLLILEKTE